MLNNLKLFHAIQSEAVSCCTIRSYFMLYNLRQFHAVLSEAVSLLYNLKQFHAMVEHLCLNFVVKSFGVCNMKLFYVIFQ